MTREEPRSGRPASRRRPPATRNGPYVVGIGASAADLAALERLCASIPPRSGAAYVVVLQLHEAVEDARLQDILGKSGLALETARDGVAVEADRIYLAPADKLLTISGGRFQVRPAEQPAGERGTIDSFLASLAQDRKENSVAVLLAGLGGDGTLGIAEVKEQGGLTLAEASEGAPSHAAAAGLVDFVLPAEEIPQHIADYGRHLARLEASPGLERLREQAADSLERIAGILRNKTGHDFHGYKQSTFLRRIQRRMQVVRLDDIERYVERLGEDAGEVHALFQDLLIGVTQFFRDPKEFDFLEAEVIPKLFHGKGAGDSVRVWVLGCSTGEEAYSIGILLREHMAKLDTVPHVQIFATDIDLRSLAIARIGRYPERVARDVSPERLARWFVREGNTYCVVKELREMCIFSSHNLVRDAPFSRIDLISCRNLLIYLDSELQERVIPLFHFALVPGGCLFLGPSENVTRHPKLFAPLDRSRRIFRKQSGTRVLPEFPLAAGGDHRLRLGLEPTRPRPRSVAAGLARQAERIAERHAPAYVVVDEAYDVLHFSGRTGRYLDPSSGAASLNLLNLVHPDLRLSLRALLHEAAPQRRPATADGLQMGQDGDGLVVNVMVEPVPAAADQPPALVVLFQDAGRAPAVQDRTGEPAAHFRDEHVQRLEAELRLTKERLQATIEELESTNEELKSSNEEYQSVNEELQSANEELETSKEELQSVNEELQTVNGELAHRVDELGRTNSDLKNLLQSTQIATVFLDNDLRVTNFTPAVTDIFHLIETDLGRPITDIASRIGYGELVEDVRKVLRTLGAVEREVENPQTGARYLVRVLPYRSLDNFIAGAVLTFRDVTAAARAQKALRESEMRFRAVAQTVPAILFTAGPDLAWDYVSPRFYEVTGLPDGAALGDGWLAALHPDDVEDNRRRWRRAAETGTPFEQEFRLRAADGAYRWFLGRAEPLPDVDGRTVKWFGSCTDIHERRRAGDLQRLLVAELQHRVKNILAIVRSLANRTVETSESLEDFALHFDGRLGALARTQNALARTADSEVDLEELVEDELIPHGARDGARFQVSGPPVRLGGKAAETLGLAVHELATNAVKYGALSAPEGRISVGWRAYDTATGPRLVFEWRESGVPTVDSRPDRNGFGRDLIERGLPYELGATTALEFGHGGVRCVIELPLAGRRASPAAAPGGEE